jgi:hypothetical protein
MKTKTFLILVSFFTLTNTSKAQVPVPEIVVGCVTKLQNGQTITLKCGNCCEYNSQSGNINTITHKCLTEEDPNCTGIFLNGKCPECYFIVYQEPSPEFSFLHATIYVPALNKKWVFNPNSSSTTNTSNQFESIITFIPIDGNLNGLEMTLADIAFLEAINP